MHNNYSIQLIFHENTVQLLNVFSPNILQKRKLIISSCRVSFLLDRLGRLKGKHQHNNLFRFVYYALWLELQEIHYIVVSFFLKYGAVPYICNKHEKMIKKSRFLPPTYHHNIVNIIIISIVHHQKAINYQYQWKSKSKTNR